MCHNYLNLILYVLVFNIMVINQIFGLPFGFLYCLLLATNISLVFSDFFTPGTFLNLAGGTREFMVLEARGKWGWGL